MRSVSRGLLALGIALGAGCGADELFVNGHVGLDRDCELHGDDDHVVEKPVFDIAPGGSSGSDACADPFVAQLWVDNPNGDRVRVTSAEVRLSTLQLETLRFDADEALPNPFLLSLASPLPAGASGVVEVEAIPEVYARQLNAFTDSEIEAEIELFGETSSGSEVGGARFRMPIEICDGCRTLCASSPEAADATCSDVELGAKRTFCVDPEC